MTFRFVRLEVTAGETPVTLQKPDMICTGYPLDIQAQLQLPAEEMNQLWEISLRTLERCMHETHEDCPYYEQLQYIAWTRVCKSCLPMPYPAIPVWHSVFFGISTAPSCRTGCCNPAIPVRGRRVILLLLPLDLMLEDYLVQTQDTETVRFICPPWTVFSLILTAA